MPRLPCTKTTPRKRKGGSPTESATCWTIGSTKRGTDGSMYIVSKLDKSQRWVRKFPKSSPRPPKSPRSPKSCPRSPKSPSSTKSPPRSPKRARKVRTPPSKSDIYSSLHAFWGFLADGKGTILVRKDKSHEVKVTPYKSRSATATWLKKVSAEAESDPSVVAILSSAMSYDAYETLERKAKGKSVEYVIQNYKKFFDHYGGKEYIGF